MLLRAPPAASALISCGAPALSRPGPEGAGRRPESPQGGPSAGGAPPSRALRRALSGAAEPCMAVARNRKQAAGLRASCSGVRVKESGATAPCPLDGWLWASPDTPPRLLPPRARGSRTPQWPPFRGWWARCPSAWPYGTANRCRTAVVPLYRRAGRSHWTWASLWLSCGAWRHSTAAQALAAQLCGEPAAEVAEAPHGHCPVARQLHAQEQPTLRARMC